MQPVRPSAADNHPISIIDLPIIHVPFREANTIQSCDSSFRFEWTLPLPLIVQVLETRLSSRVQVSLISRKVESFHIDRSLPSPLLFIRKTILLDRDLQLPCSFIVHPQDLSLPLLQLLNEDIRRALRLSDQNSMLTFQAPSEISPSWSSLNELLPGSLYFCSCVFMAANKFSSPCSPHWTLTLVYPPLLARLSSSPRLPLLSLQLPYALDVFLR